VNEPAPIDLLVTNGTVITVDAERRIFADGAVAVSGGAIIEVGQSTDLKQAYAAERVIDARGGVVQPGFVDCHVHMSQHLGRGTIPDTWPEEREHDQWLPYWTSMDEEDARCSAMLSCLEMVRNGTTLFCDSGARFSGEQNADIANQVGLRGMVGEVCWDRPPHEAVGVGDTDACVRRLERLVQALPPGPETRVWAGVGISGMGACSDRLIVAAKQVAGRHGVAMEMHQSFGDGDVARFRQQGSGREAVEHLGKLGVLGPDLILIHMIRTQAVEVPLLAASGTHVVHCPAASTRVAMSASRVGRFPEMVDAGVNVALGSDSGNYSDYFDVGRQAYLAATLHREARGEMPTITAEAALEMATLNGTHALGVDDRLGSLEAGKQADIVVHAYDRPEWRPCLDPVNSLIYSAQSTGVRTVIVQGEVILEDGRFTRVDEEAEYRRIDQAARSLYERMGWQPQDRWPVVGRA